MRAALPDISTALEGVRVLEVVSGIAGQYGGKLLVDAGATVVKLEPPGGDPLRRKVLSSAAGVRPSNLFAYLNGGKGSVVGEAHDVQRLDMAFDVIIVDEGVPDEVIATWRAAPLEHIVSITPFGRTGPWASRPATEFTLQALCGAIAAHGEPAREPLQCGGQVGEWIAGALVGVAAQMICRIVRSPGLLIDLSMLECMTPTMTPYLHLKRCMGVGSGEVRRTSVPGVHRAQDGLIGFFPITAEQFEGFLVMIESSGLIEDRALFDAAGRTDRTDLIEQIEQWASEHSVADILAKAAALRVPAAPVSSSEDLLSNDHLAYRHVLHQAPGGFMQPRPPFLPSAWSPSRSPDLGATDTQMLRLSSASGPDVAPRRLPLEGIRVLDLTAFWSGPFGTQLLAGLGADVIKIESVQRPDGQRFTTSRSPADPYWFEWCATCQAVNTNKRGITLDLARPEGLELLLRLVEDADVLIENFTPRVMENFGLSWEQLLERNPRICLIRMPGYGLDGPWRDRPALGPTVEEASGLAWLTGYSDGMPIPLGGPCDPIAGIHAAFAVGAALRSRDLAGLGMAIEVPMLETALNVSAPLIIDGPEGEHVVRRGNRSTVAAPQGVYRAQSLEGEGWVAVSVASDSHWQSLTQLMEREQVRVPLLASLQDRLAVHDELDELLSAWIGRRSVAEAVTGLSSAGVPAEEVVPSDRNLDIPQLRARGFVQRIDHAVIGSHDVPGFVIRLPYAPIVRAAATLGEHNREVFGSLLGLSAEELDYLETKEIIGTYPLGLKGPSQAGRNPAPVVSDAPATIQGGPTMLVRGPAS